MSKNSDKLKCILHKKSKNKIYVHLEIHFVKLLHLAKKIKDYRYLKMLKSKFY